MRGRWRPRQPLAHRVDRGCDAVRALRLVEQGQLLGIGQGDRCQADEPHAAVVAQRLAEQLEHGCVERLALPGLAGQRRLPGECLEALVAQLQLDCAGGQVVAAKAAGDRLGEVQQGDLQAPRVDDIMVEGVLMADALWRLADELTK